MKTYHTVLTIAGSDSSGGAGIQADLKTFSALGCYGMSVITALTAQNTQGVRSVFPVPPAFVENQLEAVLSDIRTDAVKIGMLYSARIIETVVRQLKKYSLKNVVLDPVMVSQSGDRLMQDDAIEAAKRLLMPLAAIVTPNLPEAEVLLRRKIHTVQDMAEAAKALASFGPQGILIKGGHLQGEDSPDAFYSRAGGCAEMLAAARIETRNNHGTGCTLSSAIASFLARELSPGEAVRRAKTYLTKAIEEGAVYEIGRGNGPVHHFHEFW
jgi:hydroxymethylpyrimidine/phosphomethylpyrimidine kinase